ncbi:Ig-like domain-containing protein, partial [uncultured Lacinutrix sp.]|uniref:DUF7507 domain-containing protein n=1 Tax=uncultured Lacinutrix sp. TaxID=574032 RepID=UPI0026240C05
MKIYPCKYLILIFILSSIFSFSQSQSPSIQTGVTFQWQEASQPNANSPATIKSITVDGTLYDNFVVPSSYEMTQVGPDGHIRNLIFNNGSFFANSSLPPWNAKALLAFQDLNLNHYFTSTYNGDNICGSFNDAATTNGQIQTISYDPAIPSNTGGIFAATERHANNCYYIEVYGTLAGSNTVGLIGETFIRPYPSNQNGPGFGAPPAGNTVDYWRTERSTTSNGNIGVALFYLNELAPTGSKITSVRFLAATRDHGDGKFFIIQKYAIDNDVNTCVDEIYNGDLSSKNNAPDNSTYSVTSGPTPAGQSFVFNSNGTYTYTPTPGYVGNVTFDYELCLPSPNQSVCDTATVNITYNALPGQPVLELNCNNSITVTSPVGSQYEYSINNGNYQTSNTFNGISSGDYTVSVINTITGCENENTKVFTVIDTDGDGIYNHCDLDDDNDGILDTDESNLIENLCPILNPSNKSHVPGASGSLGVGSTTLWGNVGAFQGTQMDLKVEVLSADPNINVNIDAYTDAGDVYVLLLSGAPTSGKVKLKFSFFEAGTSIPAIVTSKFIWKDLDGGSNFEEKITFNTSDLSSYQFASPTNISANIIGENTEFSSDFNTGGVSDERLWISTILSPLSSFEATFDKRVLNTGYVYGCDEFTNPDTSVVTYDTDGDGIPDLLDLDSDGDGCSDADEAYNNSDADAGDTGLYGTDTPTLANGGVNNNGLVIVAGVNGAGDSYTNTITQTANGNNTFQQATQVAITEEASDAIGCVNEEVTFTANAETTILSTTPITTASTDVTYQWMVSTDNGTTFNNISGETGTVASGTQVSLTVNNISVSQDGNIYKVLFINEANICGAESEALLSVPNPIEVITNVTNALCNTGDTGSIDITVTGGTSPYEYSWNNGASTTQDYNNIPSGVYNVLITDANGCEKYVDNISVDFDDNQAPNINVPSAITIEGCDATDITVSNSIFDYSSTTSGNVLATFNTLSNYNVNDDNNVQSVTYIDNISSSATCTIIVQRTFTAMDDCGNISTANSTITIRDTTPPDLTNCNLITQTNEECSSSENQTTLNNWNASNIALLQSCSTDNCSDSSNLVVTSNYVYSNFINSCGTSGSITVTYTVKDECNNTSTISSTITIEDTTGPDLSNCTTINQTVECDSQSIQSAASNWNNSNIDALRNCGTDSCDFTTTNNVTSNYNYSNFVSNACGGGTIEAEYSVIDDCGNISLITGTFTVEDTTPPTFNQSLPGDITVSFDNIPSVPNINASDDCGNVTVTFNETESGDICTGSYNITRTWVATDDCNLTTTHIQVLTVTQPVLGATISSQTNSLCGSSDASATVTPTGGTAPYTYQWNDSSSQTTATASNLESNTYNVTVTDSNNCSITLPVTIINSCITLVKTGVFNDEDNDNCTDVNETVTYTFTVNNTGNATVNNIILSDPLFEAPNPVVSIALASGDTNGDNVLDPTETWTYTANYTVTQDNIDAGQVTNQATVTATTLDNTTISDVSGTTSTTNDTTVITLCNDANIALVKAGVFNDEDKDNCTNVGETITYTFTLTNTGNVSIDNVVVTDPLLQAPNPLVAIVFDNTSDTDNDNELDPTETWTYTANYAVTQDDIDIGLVTNQATVNGQNVLTNAIVTDQSGTTATTNNTTVITLCQGDPSINIVKSAAIANGDPCLVLGSEVTYTFT